jgi:hypothetical protein
MIESVIANWLTKTNERNYQIPYCQVLLSKGQRVLYVSTHRPMEQGRTSSRSTTTVPITRTNSRPAISIKKHSA